MKRFLITLLGGVLFSVIFVSGLAFAGHDGHYGYHGGSSRFGIFFGPGFFWAPPPPVYYYPPYPSYGGYYGYGYPYRSGYSGRGYYYNTQSGGIIGAAIGALAGQAIGGSTEATLIGLGAGAVAGAIAGNAADQYEANQELGRPTTQEQQTQAYASPGNEAPPGQWVIVPGTWVEGKWVPSHKVWVPINP